MRVGNRGLGVQIGEARQTGSPVVNARVVFHGARSKRIASVVGAYIELAEILVVLNDLLRRKAGESGCFDAELSFRNGGRHGGLGGVGSTKEGLKYFCEGCEVLFAVGKGKLEELTLSGMAGTDIGSGEDSGSMGGLEHFSDGAIELKGKLVKGGSFGEGEFNSGICGEGFGCGLGAFANVRQKCPEAIISAFEERGSDKGGNKGLIRANIGRRFVFADVLLTSG